MKPKNLMFYKSWERRKTAGKKMVAPTGFEPATPALRGRRPKPLDDGATFMRASALMNDSGKERCVQ